MAEAPGCSPALGGGEVAPGMGQVTVGSRNEMPFALECARQKVLICVAPGRSPLQGDCGAVKSANAWLGVSFGRITFGPKEGPRGCRTLVCPGCYVFYGPCIALAAYPVMTTEAVVRCSAHGWALPWPNANARGGVRGPDCDPKNMAPCPLKLLHRRRNTTRSFAGGTWKMTSSSVRTLQSLACSLGTRRRRTGVALSLRHLWMSLLSFLDPLMGSGRAIMPALESLSDDEDSNMPRL